MKPPALGLLPGTRLASTYFPPRCGPLQDGPHDPSHPGQIFLAYSRFSHLLKRNKTWDTSVSPAVWNYTVGGNSTIKSWVGYRRKKPKGRKSSPLDDIITTSWPTQWSRQFHELLVTLTHLIQLEAEQKELLEQIIAGEQLTKDELAFHGVQWPAENKDRKPHFPGDLF